MKQVSKIQKWIILATILVLLGGVAVVFLLRGTPEIEVETVYSQLQIQVSDLHAELARPEFPQDPSLYRLDRNRIEGFPKEQPLYRKEVTKRYGSLFQVSFVLFFSDSSCKDCVASYLLLTPGDLTPTLEPISSLGVYSEPAQGDSLLFCRYRLFGDFQTSEQRKCLEQLAYQQNGSEIYIASDSKSYSMVDTFIAHATDF